MQTIRLPAGREDAAKAVAFLEALSKDKAWRVEVSEWKPRRSDEQNRYLWGVVYQTIADHLEGWDKKDIHEFCLGQCFGWETIEGFGKKKQKPVRRSSKLTKQEFVDYVAWIQREMAGHGIYIPDPNEEIE